MTKDIFYDRSKNQDEISNSEELLISNSLNDLLRKVGRAQTMSPKSSCLLGLFCMGVMFGLMYLIVYNIEREFQPVNSLGSKIFWSCLLIFIAIFVNFRIIDKSWKEIKITNEGIYYRENINSDFEYIEKKKIKNIWIIEEFRKIPISSEKISYRTTRITSQIIYGIAIRVETASYSINFPNCIVLSRNIYSQAEILNALTNKISLFYPIKHKGVRKGKVIIWIALLPVIVGLTLYLI